MHRRRRASGEQSPATPAETVQPNAGPPGGIVPSALVLPKTVAAGPHTQPTPDLQQVQTWLPGILGELERAGLKKKGRRHRPEIEDLVGDAAVKVLKSIARERPEEIQRLEEHDAWLMLLADRIRASFDCWSKTLAEELDLAVPSIVGDDSKMELVISLAIGFDKAVEGLDGSGLEAAGAGLEESLLGHLRGQSYWGRLDARTRALVPLAVAHAVRPIVRSVAARMRRIRTQGRPASPRKVMSPKHGKSPEQWLHVLLARLVKGFRRADEGAAAAQGGSKHPPSSSPWRPSQLEKNIRQQQRSRSIYLVKDRDGMSLEDGLCGRELRPEELQELRDELKAVFKDLRRAAKPRDSRVCEHRMLGALRQWCGPFLAGQAMPEGLLGSFETTYCLEPEAVEPLSKALDYHSKQKKRVTKLVATFAGEIRRLQLWCLSGVRRDLRTRLEAVRCRIAQGEAESMASRPAKPRQRRPELPGALLRGIVHYYAGRLGEPGSDHDHETVEIAFAAEKTEWKCPLKLREFLLRQFDGQPWQNIQKCALAVIEKVFGRFQRRARSYRQS